MQSPKNKEELLKDSKVMSEYNQAQDLDGGMSSWTYGMGGISVGTTVTTASTGELDDGLAVSFNVSDSLNQQSFDFEDEKLRKKYPALQDAHEHYQNVRQMCETREREEDAS